LAKKTPTLFMLCGLPCAGKSTEVEYLMRVFPDAVVLSTDDFIEARAKQLKTTYNKIFEATIGEATSDMEKRLHEAVWHNKHIIWDQTNLTPASRKKKLAKIASNYHTVAYVFNEDFEVILDRNEERGKRGKLIPYDVLDKMRKQFKVPTKEEGFKEIIFKNIKRGM